MICIVCPRYKNSVINSENEHLEQHLYVFQIMSAGINLSFIKEPDLFQVK